MQEIIKKPAISKHNIKVTNTSQKINNGIVKGRKCLRMGKVP